MSDHVQRKSLIVRWEQPRGRVFRVLRNSGLLRQTDRCQGAPDTEPFVGRYRRPSRALGQFTGALDGSVHAGSGIIVNRHPDRLLVGVVANASLRNGLASRLFEQHGIGRKLQPVAGPGLRPAVGLARAALLMLVRNQLAVASA